MPNHEEKRKENLRGNLHGPAFFTLFPQVDAYALISSCSTPKRRTMRCTLQQPAGQKKDRDDLLSFLFKK
jgi:hypothetical protein